MNWKMFGDPFELSYNRVLVLVQGERALASHESLFNRSLLAGVLDQMFQWPRGLLFTAPLSVLAWFGLPWFFRKSGSLALVFTLGTWGIYLMFATYEYFADSPFGLRFLLPMVSLSAAPLACILNLFDSHPRQANLSSDPS
jgi:hypothetical protein